MPQSDIWTLNEEQNFRLTELAKKFGTSKATLLDRAINEFLDRNNIPKPKSAEQIRNERDATLIQSMRRAAKKHDVQTEDVRRDFSTLNTTQLMARYQLPIEEVKEIQNYIKRAQTVKK
jgi:predicted transcriptional regulator